jgi:hypothetical protein
VEATEWPEPSKYLLDMDNIMDAKWGGGLFPDDGGIGLLDPVAGGFNQGDEWLYFTHVHITCRCLTH